MNSVVENNKRIAKNTVFLYIRLFITLIIGLYTSRIVLKTLGVSDYGIYSVMGGVIGMLGYVNTLLAGGTSRFLTIALGTGDLQELKETFKVTNFLCALSAIIVLILGESVGLWFMSNKLNIDPCRMDAAMWVYQCALLSSALSVLQTPFSASIISHEKMSIYAFMSIFDAVLKLAIVYFLVLSDFDKLKLYAVLLLVIQVIDLVIYRIYCGLNFKETTYRLSKNKIKIKAIFSYSGWNMVGQFAHILNDYGINILINVFYGTIVNASRGIAVQVNNVVKQFYSNFQVAARPQITKYYAKKELEEMYHLIINTSKYSGMLMLLFVIPIVANTDSILNLWLGQVPDYSCSFVRLTLIQTLLMSLDLPVGSGIMAVGKMRLPNISTALVYLMIFPMTWISMRLGASPVVGYIIYICCTPFILTIDLWILHRYIGCNVLLFIKQSIIPVFFVGLLSIIFPVILNFVYNPSNLWMQLVKVLVIIIYVAAIVYYFGLPKRIRKVVLNKIGNFIHKI